MKKNDLMPIEPGNIIYYCSTSELDKIRLEQAGKPFSEEFARGLEAFGARFYFVVGYDYDYTVIPAKKVDDMQFPSGARTEKVTECIMHYIASIK